MKKATTILLACLFLFSDAFAQADSTLPQPAFQPLQVTRFSTAVVNRNVQLSWTVSSNEEVKGFEIERAEGEGGYAKIGGRLSTGRNGNVTYEFVDALPHPKAALRYRVKAVSKDGSAVFSEVQPAQIEPGTMQFKLRQNPVRQAIELEVQASEAALLQATIFTAYGQKLSAETTRLVAGTNTLTLPAHNLLPGLHRVVLESGTERKVLSFVKE